MESTGFVDRRSATRIDKVFPVVLCSDEFGSQRCIARNISTTGMFVQMDEPLPLRTKVIVRFTLPGEDATLCAVAQVQNHYYLQFGQAGERSSLSGIGLRFRRFVAEAGAQPPQHRLH